MNNFFSKKRVLVTGHTGFKGAWLIAWLKKMGASVYGVALEPNHLSHFNAANLAEGIVDLRADIKDYDSLKKIISDIQPQHVFHLAAQSLVIDSYERPVNTWETNVLGTVHLLESLKSVQNPCTAVIITSDKCYENVEWLWGYREIDALGGVDPYSASKGAAELAIRSYVRSFFPDNGHIRIASARAGNVIGGGDWSDNRIVPDCVKAWADGSSVHLRNPSATRPWQHVLEPLSGYLKLCYMLSKNNNLHGEAFNFGPLGTATYTVELLVQEMASHWNKVRWTCDSVSDARHEATLLKLNCDKAYQYLNWTACLTFRETVQMTIDWYKNFYESPRDIQQVTMSQIDKYIEVSRKAGVWSN